MQWRARTASRAKNRAALLQACAELAAESGYRGTSLEAIATRAGVTTGAVYSIFGSKDDLFVAMLFDRMEVHGVEETGPPGLPLAEVLGRYGGIWAERIQHPDIRSLYWFTLELFVVLSAEPARWQKYESKLDEMLADAAVQLCEYAAAAGESPPPDPKTFMRSLVASLQGLSQHATATPGSIPHEWFTRIGPALLAASRDI